MCKRGSLVEVKIEIINHWDRQGMVAVSTKQGKIAVLMDITEEKFESFADGSLLLVYF